VPLSSRSRISLPERYRVVRHVANGGMASVWEAHDELLDRAVAVKLLGTHLSEDERARRRFQREARAAAGLSNHPHVVTIYDVGEYDGRSFMVMELMRGGTVADRLRSGEEIPHETTLRWLEEAASALDAAHEAGVVHRDVKPANMLLDEKGRLAIGDFGIARLALEDQLTATGQVLGTAAYISPEQAIGEPASPASDRYALAVVAYELLTGERPFQAENFAAQARAHVEDPPPMASAANPDLPPAVDEVLDRGLAKEPEERWPTSGQFVAQLDRALTPQPEPAPVARAAAVTAPTRVADTGPPPRTPVPRDGAVAPRPPRRRGYGAALAGLAMLALLAALAAILFTGGNDKQTSNRRANTPTATKKRQSPTATATATAKARQPTPTPTPSPTPTPAATSAPPPASGGVDLAAAQRLQVEGFNARRAGDYAKALTLAQQALDACGNTRQLDPCGYALFEKGVALNRLGRHREAIPVLEERLSKYGDNNKGEVAKELADAKKKAGGS
jgi:eukaryotic-like serine/threonine-protein kinase